MQNYNYVFNKKYTELLVSTTLDAKWLCPNIETSRFVTFTIALKNK